MKAALSVLLPVLIGVTALLLIIYGVMALVRRKLGGWIRRKYAGQTIIRESISANFFGLTSVRMAQVRGNGALVLTPDELYFVLFAPRHKVTIPLREIISVSTPRSHLGKTVGMKLLRVDFRKTGGQDSVAWSLRDVDQWKTDIEHYKSH